MRFLVLAPLLLTFAVHPSLAAPAPPGEGSKAFVARPKFGAAVFDLPAQVRWRSTVLPDGRYRLLVMADVNVVSVQRNIKALSAQALDRDIPCDKLVKVRSAAARLVAPRAIGYDLRFRYAKRVCAGGLPLELPAEVTCASRIALSAAKSIIVIDVRGAASPPCRIEGAAAGISEAIHALVGFDVFKRHAIDVARVLPKEFQGVTVDIRALAFDLPPKLAVLHVAGESTMTAAQFNRLMARLNAAAVTN
jgi:hypothetical protein